MSKTLSAFDHREWERLKLADYGDFSDKTTECNQEDWGDCSRGEWYYIHPLPVENEDGTFRVIYNGDWGNDHSPGASSYTYATLYDEADEDDMRRFVEAVKEWEEAPEWIEEDD